MAARDEIADLTEETRAFEESLGGTRAVMAAFDAELRGMQATFVEAGRDADALSRGINRGLRRSFDGLVFDGDKLSDALKGVAQSLVNAAYSAAVRPVVGHLGGIVASGVDGLLGGLTPFQRGASFAQGRVMPFASGGVVKGPVAFPMRGGTGLMGEAGPEAILPLDRGADGKLGVRSTGASAGGVSVVMNITTPDVEGFRRSQTQIAAQLGRALTRGQRNR